MERIVIPQRATRSPVALTDVIVGAPMLSRLVLGATGPGQLLAAGALGAYIGSASRDWYARRGVRPVDFQAAFGADVDTLTPMTREQRLIECRELAQRMSDAFVPDEPDSETIAVDVDRLLTDYIANITGQQVITSTSLRGFTLARVAVPFAVGACDAISGDVAIFQHVGLLQPHVIAHEFVHRKGYHKELHAQALAYLALRNSGQPVYVQAARAERLQRNLAVLSGDDSRLFDLTLAGLPLRPELHRYFDSLGPAAPRKASPVNRALRAVYDARLRATGQNGISDYDRGFTDFLHTFRHSRTATQPASHTEW